jgi:general secretion pathway protein G
LGFEQNTAGAHERGNIFPAQWVSTTGIPTAIFSPAMPNSIRTLRRHVPGARGFTLIEIMVVLAIIGMIVGIAVTSIGNSLERARQDIAHTFVNSSLKGPLMGYSIDMGGFPATADGLQALCTAPQGAVGHWRGPYVTEGKIPLDPWNQPYQYVCPGKHNPKGYDLWSKGPDKLDGTEDDIGNWDNPTEGATGK